MSRRDDKIKRELFKAVMDELEKLHERMAEIAVWADGCGKVVADVVAVVAADEERLQAIEERLRLLEDKYGD